MQLMVDEPIDSMKPGQVVIVEEIRREAMGSYIVRFKLYDPKSYPEKGTTFDVRKRYAGGNTLVYPEPKRPVYEILEALIRRGNGQNNLTELVVKELCIQGN